MVRFFRPLLKRGATALSKELLDLGTDVLNDESGAPVREVLKQRSKKAVENLKTKVVNKLEPIIKGDGRRKRKRSCKLTQSLSGTAGGKRKRKCKPKPRPNTGEGRKRRKRKSIKRKHPSNPPQSKVLTQAKKRKKAQLFNDIFSTS